MNTQQVKQMKLCKHCDTTYPATNEHFYTEKGKLRLSICKECKKKKSKVHHQKARPTVYVYRDRKEYSKMYYTQKKLKKQELDSKDSKDI